MKTSIEQVAFERLVEAGMIDKGKESLRFWCITWARAYVQRSMVVH